MLRGPRFQDFVTKKTREAECAVMTPLHTIEDHSAARTLPTIGNDWTRRHYDGDFHLFDPPPDLPAMSMVFVQSRDGNTGIDNPEDLGGGPTDTHLIYEGLSRVAADAVLAGAATAGGREVFFSVWHPELVALRHELGLPRHPAQIVMSNEGRINLDALLFNVPEVPVFLIVGDRGRQHCASALADKPWITVMPLHEDDLRNTFAPLRIDHRFSRISVVGGRHTASALVDAGLIQDLCLTTTARQGGEPDTPFYVGRRTPGFEIIVKKHGMGAGGPLLFDHLTLVGI